VKREGDEGLEAARLGLQRAQAQHVIDALLDGLDRPVEHRAVRAQPEPVGRAVHLEPLVGRALVVAQLLAHARPKISAPPPGIESRPAARRR